MKRPMQRRRGFSLVEVTVACVLTAFLATMLSTTWRLVMPSTADLIVWGQVFQELDVAVTALSRDIGGSLPDNGHVGTKGQGMLLQCRKVTDVDGDHFQMCFDSASPNGNADWGSPDTVVDYHVDAADRKLIRSCGTTAFTVARNVDSILVTPVTISGVDYFQIDLTLSCDVKSTHKALTRKCTLIAKKDP
jgi:type II secretory pathway pseudopilin PulG